MKDRRDERLLNVLEATTSKCFLPFRAVLSRLDRRRRQIDPYLKDLFDEIDGG